jgi:peptidoglycan/LPS O-acetylase OafA/YrhL
LINLGGSASRALALLGVAGSPEHVWALTVREIFLIPTTGPVLFPLVFVAWSLFYELVVNAIYAHARPILTTKRLLLISVVLYFLILGAAAKDGTLDMGWSGTPSSAAEGLARSALGIFLGVALFRMRTRIWSALPNIPPIAPVIVICAILVAPPCDLEWTVDMLALLAFPWLVMSAAKGTAPLPRIMATLGASSYPMYLLHGAAHITVMLAFPAANFAPFSGIVFAVAIFSTCLALERWYELPARRFLKNVADRSTGTMERAAIPIARARE